MHVSVHDSIAVTSLGGFWVCEFIDQRHFLDDVTVHVSDQVVKVVGVVSVRQPERDVVDVCWLIAEGLKL